MKQNTNMKLLIASVLVLLIVLLLTSACSRPKNTGDKQLKNDSKESNALYDTIAHMDSLLFAAFNARDINKIKTMFSADLEFYHDLGGVTDYEQNMVNFKKTFDSDRRVRRELVAGSLKVYPIANYGAVEVGSHRFYGTEKGKEERLGSEAKFVQVWQKKESAWKVTRVISYAHEEH